MEVEAIINIDKKTKKSKTNIVRKYSMVIGVNSK